MHIEGHILVAGLCGSLRPSSYTRQALQIALQGAQEVGAQTQLIDLRDYDLIFCGGKPREVEYPEGVLKLRQAIQPAQGILLGTPEYHGSFSGVLKNALDLMGFDEFEGKMIGLVSVSAGEMGGAQALASLRIVGRALHAWVIPEQVSVPRVEKAFDAQGKLRDPVLQKRLTDVGRQVARFAYLHSSEKVREFMRLWESAPANPGGGETVELDG